MSCDGDEAWKGILVRTSLAGVFLMLLSEAREKRLAWKRGHLSIATLYNQLLIGLPESERFFIWRMNKSQTLLAGAKGIHSCLLMLHTGYHAVRGWRDWRWFYQICYAMLAYIILHFAPMLAPQHPPIEIFFWFSTASWPFVLAGLRSLDPVWIFAGAPGLRIFRALMSVTYMRWHVSALGNLWYTMVACYFYTQRAVLDQSLTWPYCSSEMGAWICITLLCLTTETWFKEVFAREHAAERLVLSYCDTLVRLGPDLRIIQPTARLTHLMCPTRLVGPHVLTDTLFSEHLATAADKESFAAFLSNTSGSQSEGPAPALCVTLHHELGCEVFVELVHVSIDVIGRDAEHWIAIREMRREGKAPDESLFHGEKTSSTHQMQSFEGNTWPQLVKESREFGKRVRKSHRSSQSSRSSSSESTSYAPDCTKRELVGLDRIRVRLNSELKMSTYALCFEDQSKLPDLKTCLVGEPMAPFYSWLQESMNELLWDDSDYLDYPGEVWFRPPNAACASSAIVLCAEGARLRSYEDDVEDDIENNDDSFLPSLELQLFRVSQVIARRRGREQTCHQLQALLEEDLPNKLSGKPTLHE